MAETGSSGGEGQSNASGQQSTNTQGNEANVLSNDVNGNAEASDVNSSEVDRDVAEDIFSFINENKEEIKEESEDETETKKEEEEPSEVKDSKEKEQPESEEPQEVIPDEEPKEEVKEDKKEEKELHKLFIKFKEKYKDTEFKSDEEILDKIAEEIEGLESDREKNLNINRRLINLFEAEPGLARAIRDYDKGASFHVALARHIDVDNLRPQEDDPDYDEWNKALESRKKEQEEADKKKSLVAENEKVSAEAMKKFFEEKKMDEKTSNEFIKTVNEFLNPLVNERKVSNEFLEFAYKAMNYDNDLAEARELSAIKERNKKIEENIDASKKGDGLPKLDQKQEKEKPPKKKVEKDWLDDVVNNLEDNLIE